MRSAKSGHKDQNGNMDGKSSSAVDVSGKQRENSYSMDLEQTIRDNPDFYKDPNLYSELNDTNKTMVNNEGGLDKDIPVTYMGMQITQADMDRMLLQARPGDPADEDIDDELEADLRELALTSSAISKKLDIHEFNDNNPFGKDFDTFLGIKEPPEIEDLNHEDDKVVDDNGIKPSNRLISNDEYTNTVVNKFAWKSYIPPKEGPGLIFENTQFYQIEKYIKLNKRGKNKNKNKLNTKKSDNNDENADSKELLSETSQHNIAISLDDIDRLFNEATNNMGKDDEEPKPAGAIISPNTPLASSSDSKTDTPNKENNTIITTRGRKALPLPPTYNNGNEEIVKKKEHKMTENPVIITEKNNKELSNDQEKDVSDKSSFAESAFDISSGSEGHGYIFQKNGTTGYEQQDPLDNVSSWIDIVTHHAPTKSKYSKEGLQRINVDMYQNSKTGFSPIYSGDSISPSVHTRSIVTSKSSETTLPKYSAEQSEFNLQSNDETQMSKFNESSVSGLRKKSDIGSDIYSVTDGKRRVKPVSKSQKMSAVQSIFTDQQKIAYIGLSYLSIMHIRQERFIGDSKATRRALASYDRWSKKFMDTIYIYLDIPVLEQAMIMNLTKHGIQPEDFSRPIIHDVQRNAELLQKRQEEQQKKEQELLDAGLPLLDLDEAIINGDTELTDVRYTILTHLFIISISEGKYDSRSRATLKQVGLYLDVPVIDVLRLEATIGEQLRMYEDSRDPTKDQTVVERRNKSDVKRRWIATGIAALAGGAVIGLTAGLAAPLIAGGIGVALTTLGVSGASGVMASTGAIALITTGGILTGGGMGGAKMLKRTKGVEEFEFLNVAQAKQDIKSRKEKNRHEIFKKRRREAREAIIKRLQRNNSPFVHTTIKYLPDSILFDLQKEYPGISQLLNEALPEPLAILDIEEKMKKKRRKSSLSKTKSNLTMSSSTNKTEIIDEYDGVRLSETPNRLSEASNNSLPSDILNPFDDNPEHQHHNSQNKSDIEEVLGNAEHQNPILPGFEANNPWSPTEVKEESKSNFNDSGMSKNISNKMSVDKQSSNGQESTKLPPPVPNRPNVIMDRVPVSVTSKSKSMSVDHNSTDSQPALPNLDDNQMLNTEEAQNLLDELQSTVAGQTVAGDKPYEDGMIFKDDEEDRPRQASVLLTIAGWLTYGNDDFVLPFSTMEEGIYGEHYSLVWESKVLLDLGSALSLLVSEIASFLVQQGLQATVLSTLMIGLAGPLWTMKLSYLIDNPWGIGISKASKVGKVLADFLIQGVQEDRPITLVGYSLGARVIYHCLLELADRGAYGLVEEAYLFGCPVMASTKEWKSLSNVVSGRIINGYCENDMVLGILYRASTAVWSGVAGLRPIEGVPGVENINLSEIVKGHLDYRVLLPQVLKIAGFSTTSDYFSDVDV